MAGSSVNSQTDIDFVGESLFRANGFGVTNHKFDVCLLITNQSSEWVCYDSPYITGSCSNEIYEGSWDDIGNYTYALRVYPWSVCDHEDYVNGVGTADLIDIGYHIRDSILITDPYMMVSADATGDKQIDTYDIISIRDVILGNTTGFMDGSNPGRTSWEWWNREELEDLGATWEANPWNYTINENWPGGIIFGGLSKSDLEDENNHPDWFDYRTTKVGDIRSHGTPASTNSWVCGSYSLKNPKMDTRQSLFELFELIPSRRIDAGDELELSFSILSSESLLGFQIPFYLDKNIEVISFQNNPDFSIFWNHAEKLNFFMALWYTLDGKIKKTDHENAIFKIRLRALKDIDNLRDYLSQQVTQNIELIEPEGILTHAEIRATLLNYFPVQFQAIYKNTTGVLQLFSEGSQTIDIERFTLAGQLIFKDRVYIDKGISEIKLKDNHTGLLSFIKVSNGKTSKVIKTF
ncbi:MAG: hypothetical protein IPM34_12595 [Saprospiraceae bacterium]|nr:hypothetical protein [Saprospiraceae bacterium]